MRVNNALIISPHPDDLEIGMGGSAAKMIDGGAEVVSLVVTDGRRSTSASGLSEDQVAELRKDEVREAASILKLHDLILLGLHDAAGDDNRIKLQDELKKAIKRFQPREIYIPHPEIDKHPTHREVSRAVIDTLKEMSDAGEDIPQHVWCYEVWTPFPHYDRIEDVSHFIEFKSASINAHKSQLEYKNYTQGILGLNRYRAVFDERHGVTDELYAEVFIEHKL